MTPRERILDSAFSHQKKSARRSTDKARADRDSLLFEGAFRTGIQQHTCLEPHATAARAAKEDARPLRMTGNKLDLLSGLVQDLLEQCAG
jgi:hypothetical protein